MLKLPEFGLQTVAYVGIFLGVLLLFEGIRQLLSRSEDARAARNRRMRMIARGATGAEVLTLLKPAASPWSLSRLPFVGDLPQVMRRAGMTMRPGAFLATCLGVTTVLTLTGAMRIGPLPALGLGLILGFVLPVFLVRRAAAKRLDKLTRQLPDALELMARGLRVGHPLNATIASVAHDMSDPIATEFGIMVDQVSYGDELVDAFADFATRTETEDTRFLATSVAIQEGTGSDLARILNTLSKVIRSRLTMRRRILAISAEGRLTANFLSLLPLVIVGETFISAPQYYPGVANDPLFMPLAILVVILTVGNYVVMRWLVHFRI